MTGSAGDQQTAKDLHDYHARYNQQANPPSRKAVESGMLYMLCYGQALNVREAMDATYSTPAARREAVDAAKAAYREIDWDAEWAECKRAAAASP